MLIERIVKHIAGVAPLLAFPVIATAQFSYPQPIVPVYTDPFMTAIGDLDGDAITDVMTTFEGSSDLVLYKGSEDLLIPHLICDTIYFLRALAIADIDADGDNDVLLHGNGGVAAFLNIGGTGQFDPGFLLESQGVSWSVKSMAVGDLDHDAFPDLLVSAHPNGELLWVEISGTPMIDTLIMLPTSNAWMEIVDLDLNDTMEVLFNPIGSTALYSCKDTTGSADLSSPALLLDDLATLDRVFHADLNGDDREDLVVNTSDPSSGQFLHLQDSLGGFSNAETIYMNSSAREVILVGDLNGDGDHDMLIQRTSSFYMDRLMNDGAGNFDQVVYIPIYSHDYRHALMRDLNADGLDDLIFTRGGGSDRVEWYERVDIAFAQLPSQHMLNPFGQGNAGGPVRVDTMSLWPGAPLTLLLVSQDDQRISLLHTEPDRTFTIDRVLTDRFEIVRSFAIGDVASDGDQDLLVSHLTGPWEQIGLLSSADSLFQSFTLDTIATFDYGASCDLVDIDGDGYLDILDRTGDRFRWSLDTDGDGHFEFTDSLLGAAALAAGPWDPDHDGDPDILAFDLDADDGHAIKRIENLGAAPYFQWLPDIDTLPFPPRDIALHDLDQNGWVDLLTLAAEHAWWYPNTGGSLGAPVQLFEEDGLFRISAGDIDLDGHDDLVLLDYGSGFYPEYEARLFWMKNAGDPHDPWTEHYIQGDISYQSWGLLQLELADLDQNGSLDILLVDDNIPKVCWNELPVGVIDPISEFTKSLIHVFPSPAVDQVRIECACDLTKGALEVIDLDGRMAPVRTTIRSDRSAVIQTGQLAQGIYLIRTTGRSGICSGRFVIVR